MKPMREQNKASRKEKHDDGKNDKKVIHTDFV